MTDPNHHSALVSVPVGLMRESLKAAEQFIVNGVEFGYIRMPDYDGDTAHSTLPMIRNALALLLAAPAAPQAAGVGEEAIDRFERAAFANVQNLPRGEAARAAEMDRRDVEYKAARLALSAPSREPEGGAVDAFDRIHRLAVEFNPDIQDIDDTLSEINQIALSALATRKEAPADHISDARQMVEAPAEAVTADSLRSVSDETMRALLSCKDVGSGRAHLASIINALRAQPTSREDAQPDTDCVSLLADLDAGKPVGREAAATIRSLIAERRAPDAMRETFEDIKSAADSFRDCEGDEVAHQVIIRCDQALAALQAERGAK